MGLTVCRTWLRLERAATGGDGRQQALNEIYQALPCDELREPT